MHTESDFFCVCSLISVHTESDPCAYASSNQHVHCKSDRRVSFESNQRFCCLSSVCTPSLIFVCVCVCLCMESDQYVCVDANDPNK